MRYYKDKILYRIFSCSLLFFIFISFYNVEVNAKTCTFYNQCIPNTDTGLKGGTLSIVSTESFYINPVGRDCYDGCESTCKINFPPPSENQENNADTINNIGNFYECLKTCQKGYRYVGRKMQSEPLNGINKIKYSEQITSDEINACKDTTKRYYRSKFPLKPYLNGGDQYVILKLSISQDHPYNTLYMCGKSSINLIPTFPNLFTTLPQVMGYSSEYNSYFNDGRIIDYKMNQADNANSSTASPPQNWDMTYKQFQACLANISSPVWYKISNEDIRTRYPQMGLSDNQSVLYYPYPMTPTTINIDHFQKGAIFNCYWDWSVYKSNYTDTGISIRSGDELLIEWTGDIVKKINGKYETKEKIDKSTLESMACFFLFWESCPKYRTITHNVPMYYDYKTAKLARFAGGYYFATPAHKMIIEDDQKNDSDVVISWKELPDKDSTTALEEGTIRDALGDPLELMRKLSTIEVEGLDPLIGENARSNPSNQNNNNNSNSQITNVPCGYAGYALPSNDDHRTWYGLEGYVLDQPNKMKGSVQNSNLNNAKEKEQALEKKITSDNLPLCSLLSDPGLSTYGYKGIVSDLQPMPLRIRHKTGLPGDMVAGGYNVRIDWGGCPIYDGKGLQYAVIKDGYTPSNGDWHNVNINALQDDGKVDIKVSSFYGNHVYDQYYMYFRIDPDVISDPYLDITNAIGGYNIEAEYPIPQVKGYIIRPLIEQVMSVLFGTKDIVHNNISDDSVIKILYNGIVKNVRPLVLSIMTLYITFLGLGFIIGTINIDQKEVVIRIIKIAFVIAVISDTSWNLFSTYVIPMVTAGGLELASRIVPVISSATSSSETFSLVYSDDPMDLLNMLDGGLIGIVLSMPMKKMLGLLTSNLLGFVIAIIIFISLLRVAISVIKVTIIYLSSLICSSMLLLVAPLFFSFVLFQITEEWFKKWFKYALSYILIPPFLFTTVALFYMVFVLLISAVFNFTVCESCLLKIDFIPLVPEFCIIPWYSPLMNAHMPSVTGLLSFYTPIGIASAAIALLVTTGSMIDLVTFVVTFVQRMTTSTYGKQSADITTGAEVAGGLYQMGGNAAQSLAMKGAGKIGGAISTSKSDKKAKREKMSQNESKNDKWE